MKKSKIDNVYVEYKRDPISKEEFLSAILVEKGDSTLYYSVPNYYLKLNSKQKLKFQDKLSEKLKELKTHVGKDKIVINTEDGLRKIEQFEQEQLRFTNTYDLVVFVQMALPFIYPPHAGGKVERSCYEHRAIAFKRLLKRSVPVLLYGDIEMGEELGSNARYHLRIASPVVSCRGYDHAVE